MFVELKNHVRIHYCFVYKTKILLPAVATGKINVCVLQAFPDIMIRQGSIDDINAQQFLKISNYEDTVRQLDIYYAIG